MPKSLNWVTLLWNPREPWSRLIYVFSISSILITIGILLTGNSHNSFTHNLGLGIFLIGDFIAIIGILMTSGLITYMLITRMLKKE